MASRSKAFQRALVRYDRRRIASMTADSAERSHPIQQATLGTRADEPLILSIVVPVRNDAPSVQVMVRILDAMIDVSKEVLVVYDDQDDTCMPVIHTLHAR